MIFGEQIRGAARVRKAERTLLLLRSEGRLATKIEISGISLPEYPVKMIFGEQIRGAARVRKAERTKVREHFRTLAVSIFEPSRNEVAAAKNHFYNVPPIKIVTNNAIIAYNSGNTARIMVLLKRLWPLPMPLIPSAQILA